MKKIDITEKLSFDKKPVLVIKDKELEVDNSAMTVLKIMGMIGNDEPSPKDIGEAYEILFSPKDRKKLDALNLGFTDLIAVIQAAVSLITGETSEGE